MKRILSLILMILTLFFTVEFYNFCHAETKHLDKKYQRYYAQYDILKAKHKWLNLEIYRIIKVVCHKKKLSEALVCAVIQIESGNFCNNNLKKMEKVRGSSGEIGLMQVIPRFHLLKGETPKDLEKPEFNITKGCGYLKDCLQLAHNDLRTALKNYNSGYYSDFYNDPYIYKITKIYVQTVRALNFT